MTSVPVISDGIRSGVNCTREKLSDKSRASVLTGMWSRSQGRGGRANRVGPVAVRTLYPLQLRAAGYRTGFIGKWQSFMPNGFNQVALFHVY